MSRRRKNTLPHTLAFFDEGRKRVREREKKSLIAGATPEEESCWLAAAQLREKERAQHPRQFSDSGRWLRQSQQAASLRAAATAAAPFCCVYSSPAAVALLVFTRNSRIFFLTALAHSHETNLYACSKYTRNTPTHFSPKKLYWLGFSCKKKNPIGETLQAHMHKKNASPGAVCLGLPRRRPLRRELEPRGRKKNTRAAN